MSDIVVSSRVRLARNYEDLPFRPRMKRQEEEACVQRTLDALKEVPESYTFIPLQSAGEVDKKVLVESHMISPDLESQAGGAALIRRDEKVSVMMNEEDHLRIQGFAAGEDLHSAAQCAYQVEDELQRHMNFAFDAQLGYLTSCPTNIGTGLRASMMLHLPMLTVLKQMGKVTQLAAKLGLTLRGIYGEGSEAQGYLYQLSNQVTLGKTEQEIMDSVTALARQVAEMERVFRQKTWEKDSVSCEDQMFRSLGILQNARRMTVKEFMAHYSNIRIGAAMGKLPLSVAECDDMLIKAQPAHVKKAAGKELTPREADEKRCALIRAALCPGKE